MDNDGEKKHKWFIAALELNYFTAVISMILTLVFMLAGKISLIELDGALYGAIGNNLTVVILYLIMITLVLPGYCFVKKQYLGITLLGFFYLLLIGSMEIYSYVNAIPLNREYYLLFFYVGLSHMIFGMSVDQSEHRTEKA